MSGRSPSLTAHGAAIFAALGDVRRLGILTRLATDGPLSITRLSERTDVSRQAITRHLDVLVGAGLVSDERRGRERVFEVDSRTLERARRDLGAISARWDRSIQRLREQVEG